MLSPALCIFFFLRPSLFLDNETALRNCTYSLSPSSHLALCVWQWLLERVGSSDSRSPTGTSICGSNNWESLRATRSSMGSTVSAKTCGEMPWKCTCARRHGVNTHPPCRAQLSSSPQCTSLCNCKAQGPLCPAFPTSYLARFVFSFYLFSGAFPEEFQWGVAGCCCLMLPAWKKMAMSCSRAWQLLVAPFPP